MGTRTISPDADLVTVELHLEVSLEHPGALSNLPHDDMDEWDEYEEAGPMDLEDQLDRLLGQS